MSSKIDIIQCYVFVQFTIASQTHVNRRVRKISYCETIYLTFFNFIYLKYDDIHLTF